MNYDISLPPPTRQELEAEKIRLNSLKKQQIKASIISDSCHALCFLALYTTDNLSGAGLLLAIILATFVAFALANATKKQLSSSGFAAIALASMTTMFIVAGISIWVLEESLLGGTLSALASGSVVVAGAVIGRKFFHVFIGLDSLKNVAEDEFALQELQSLCRNHPELAEYRQQARDVLRPNLTFGELQAMRDWVVKKVPS
jgi:hypothetical protein